MAYIKRRKTEKKKVDPKTREIVEAENENKWQGPFANKAGEWVANHVKNMPHLLRKDVRIGKPKWCRGMTSEDLERLGFEGTYLIKDQAITGDPSVFVEVDTDLLCEEVVSGQRPPTKDIDPKYLMETVQ
jgi:hypothetical protein